MLFEAVYPIFQTGSLLETKTVFLAKRGALYRANRRTRVKLFIIKIAEQANSSKQLDGRLSTNACPEGPLGHTGEGVQKRPGIF